jgi:SAM-dependent methyltransferase
MTRKTFEQYDAHYLRLQARRDSKRLEPYELQCDRAPRWLHRLSKDAHILDYGCADGYMLWVLHALGYRNLVGADISESVLRHARTRLEGTNVDLRHLESASLDDCAGRFDAILTHQVLEHIPRAEVVPTLERLRDCLKRGGISVAVPNAGSLAGGFNQAIDFTHVVAFNECSLTQVLELAGFVGIEIVFHPPKLFFSWRHPIKVAKRFLSRICYILTNFLHRAFYVLVDQRPLPQCFEFSIELLGYHPNAVKRHITFGDGDSLPDKSGHRSEN